MILPDAFLLADFMADRAARDVLEGLARRRRARCARNLEPGGGLVFSQRVLLALTAAGLARDEAYAIVQDTRSTALDGGAAFRDALARRPARARACSADAARRRASTLEPYLRNVDALFARARATRRR